MRHISILELGHTHGQNSLINESSDLVSVSVDWKDECAIELQPRPLSPPHLHVLGGGRANRGSRVGEEGRELGTITLDDEVLVVLGVNPDVNVLGIEAGAVSDDEVALGGLGDVECVTPARHWLEVGVLMGGRRMRRVPALRLEVGVAGAGRGSKGIEHLGNGGRVAR